MQIGTFNVRRIVITVMVLLVAGLTATAALANSAHFKKGRGPNCLMAGSAISKSVTCGAGLAVPASVPDNNNTLPYDEFGLSANQPNQPQVGNAGPQTGRAVVAHSPRQPAFPYKPAFPTTTTRCPTTSSGSARTSRTSPRSETPARKLDGLSSPHSPRPPPFPYQPAFPTTTTRCPTTSSGSARTSRTSPRSVTPARKPDSGETHLREGAPSCPLSRDAALKRMA